VRTRAILLAALLAPAFAPQGDPSPARDRDAVLAFRQGDLETARSAWLAELEEGAGLPQAERGRILYDLGNVAFRKGDVLEAVGWYTASLRLRPRDADAWRNLEHARTTAKLEPADRGDLAATVERLLSALTLEESQWLVLVATVLWAGALAGEALRGGRVWRRLSIGGLCLVLASLAPWAWNRARTARDPVLVIEGSERGAEVRSEPREGAAVVATVAAGEELERLDALPDWTKGELPGGSAGWARGRSLFSLRR